MALSKNSSIIRSEIQEPRNNCTTENRCRGTRVGDMAGIFTRGLVFLLSGDIVPPEVDRSILRKPNKDSHEQ